MILETQEEIHQWLKKQCPAFVRYVGDDLSSLCNYFLLRINRGSGGFADLTHLSHGRRIAFSHMPFKGYRINRHLGRIFVNEPEYWIAFCNQRNKIEQVFYPDKQAFNAARDSYYAKPETLDTSFYEERLKKRKTYILKKWGVDFKNFVRPYWGGSDAEFDAWISDFADGTVDEIGVWEFWSSVVRDFRFNETEPLPDYDLKQKKLVLHSRCSGRFERFALCFFRYLIASRFPDRERLIAPLRRIYFNEGRYAAWVRMIEKNYAPDFEKTFPKSGKVDHAFSSAENLKAAKVKGLDLREEDGIVRVFWQGNAVPAFDGLFSIPSK